jgi:hypothetical protein
MKLSRRGFAAGAGALLAGGAGLALPPVRRTLCGSPEQRYRQDAMASIGRCDPALSRDAVRAGWRALGTPDGERLAGLVAADFAEGRTRQVDGWLLASTEVLACWAGPRGCSCWRHSPGAGARRRAPRSRNPPPSRPARPAIAPRRAPLRSVPASRASRTGARGACPAMAIPPRCRSWRAVGTSLGSPPSCSTRIMSYPAPAWPSPGWRTGSRQPRSPVMCSVFRENEAAMSQCPVSREAGDQGATAVRGRYSRAPASAGAQEGGGTLSRSFWRKVGPMDQRAIRVLCQEGRRWPRHR